MNICETRRKILLAAKNEFANRGYNGARMSSIATLAEVNQALLHYHYKSKENLYLQVFEKFIGEKKSSIVMSASEEIKNWFVTPEIELYANLYLHIHAHLLFVDDELERLISKAIIDKSNEIKNIARNYFIPHMETMKRIIEKGRKEGVFETTCPELLILNIFTFSSDVLQAEFILSGGEWQEKIYTDKESKILNHIIETTFKSLRPADGKLDIPELDGEQMTYINSVLDKIKKERFKCE